MTLSTANAKTLGPTNRLVSYKRQVFCSVMFKVFHKLSKLVDRILGFIMVFLYVYINILCSIQLPPTLTSTFPLWPLWLVPFPPIRWSAPPYHLHSTTSSVNLLPLRSLPSLSWSPFFFMTHIHPHIFICRYTHTNLKLHPSHEKKCSICFSKSGLFCLIQLSLVSCIFFLKIFTFLIFFLSVTLHST